MKTCPICNTTLFDDMEVCYGCMYSFGSKPELERKARDAASETSVITSVREDGEKLVNAREDVVLSAPAPREDVIVANDPLPLALLAQATSSMPGWGIRFEMHDASAPDRTWSMELTPPSIAAVV